MMNYECASECESNAKWRRIAMERNGGFNIGNNGGNNISNINR